MFIILIFQLISNSPPVKKADENSISTLSFQCHCESVTCPKTNPMIVNKAQRSVASIKNLNL